MAELTVGVDLDGGGVAEHAHERRFHVLFELRLGVALVPGVHVTVLGDIAVGVPVLQRHLTFVGLDVDPPTEDVPLTVEPELGGVEETNPSMGLHLVEGPFGGNSVAAQPAPVPRPARTRRQPSGLRRRTPRTARVEASPCTPVSQPIVESSRSPLTFRESRSCPAPKRQKSSADDDESARSRSRGRSDPRLGLASCDTAPRPANRLPVRP